MSRPPYGNNPPLPNRPTPQQQPYQGHADPRNNYHMNPGYGRGPSTAPPQQSNGVQLQVAKVDDKTLQSRLIYENICAVSPQNFAQNRDGGDIYVLIRNLEGREFVVTARVVNGFPAGCISLSEPQRTWCRIGLRDVFEGRLWSPHTNSEKGSAVYVGAMDVEVSFASATRRSQEKYNEDDLAHVFTQNFQNQVVQPGQRFLMDVASIPLLIVVKTIALTDLMMSSTDQKTSSDPNHRGILMTNTAVTFHQDAKGELKMATSMKRPNPNAIIAPDFKFEDMGIGGLADEFSTIFRRAFASRVFPPALVEKLGIQHVKGILLYGPPGTGKTLMARQIGKMLNSREPKIINGPEILNKFVGQSEENVRKMFADAEKEYKEKGDQSGLHVIIFDELDAVCKQRGTGGGGGTGVGDSVVNQLLTKLDGVDQLNNILLIGMTNRKDMIDEALLRPGRLEVQLEISLPNAEGRLQILNIHTSKMKENGVLGDDVNLGELAQEAKNYSGAEISGLVKAATSFAFTRHTKVDQLAGIKDDVSNMKVTHKDFVQALAEVRPAYGVDDDDLAALVPMDIIPFNQEHIQNIINQGIASFRTVKEAERKRHQTLLFHGPPASGKTALAAEIARMSGYPFVKVVTPSDLIPYRDELSKKDYIARVFSDAYKSALSLVILDDFERLIEWTPIGSRFSNNIFSALSTLIRTPPPKDHRLLVFVTSSKMSVLKMLEVADIFEKSIYVRPLETLEELSVLLRESRMFEEAGIRHICDHIRDTAYQTETERQLNRGFRVDVGIKNVLDFLAEAKVASQPDEQGNPGKNPAAVFSSLMIDRINVVKGMN